jgi:hypothetical protein
MIIACMLIVNLLATHEFLCHVRGQEGKLLQIGKCNSFMKEDLKLWKFGGKQLA